MRFLLGFLLTISYLFANIGTVVDVVGKSTLIRDGKKTDVVQKLQLKKHDIIKTGENAKVKIFFLDNTAVSLGKSTIFDIDSYSFDNTKKSNIKFNVVKGFFKTVTGRIGKIAPNRFKLKTKNATIGIRGTVFAAHVGVEKDTVFCTDGEIVLHTPGGDFRVKSGELGRALKGKKPRVRVYSQEEKEKIINDAGWNGERTIQELIAYIKENFEEPLRSQLLATLQNILDKDSDERRKFIGKGKEKSQNADDIGFVDDITINGREFDSLEQREIEFYPEDLKDGRIVIDGLLESESETVAVKDLFVEITIDGGNTWTRAKGHSEWEWSFKPELEKTYEFSLRVVKLSTSKKYKVPLITGISIE